MRRLLVLLSLALTLSCTSSSTPRPQHPDLILLNGKVFTADGKRPWVEAIAIRGDRITAVGTTNEIRALANADTNVINLLGRTVVPGINDAHVHAPWTAPRAGVDIAPDATAAGVMARVRDAAGQHPPGTWLEGEIPLPLMDDPGLTREALDAVTAGHPVRLGNLGGHAYLLNSAALRAWNLAESNPDGWIVEHAAWAKLAEEAATQSDEQLIDAMRAFAKEAVALGITSVQTMPLVSVDRLAPLAARIDVPLRWRWIDFQMARVNENPTRPVKYILDGTPIERGAALRKPYSDRADKLGVLNYSDEDLRRIVRIAAQSDQQLVLHISGDLALEKLFAAMRSTPADWGAKRVRVEHGEFIGSFASEAAEFGIVLVQNPAHLMIAEMLQARFGEDRVRNLQALRSMARRDVPVALGSDGPLNPWLNVMFATLHPTNPSEAVTREWAVTAYTAGSAFAEFTEGDKGTIAPGKLADIAVLSQDVFNAPREELPRTTAVLTIIGGKVVHGQP